MTVRRWIIVGAFALAVGLLSANLLSIATAEDSWYDMQLLLQIVDGWWHGERTLYPTFAEGQQAPGFPSYRYPPVWAVSMMPLISVFELRPAVAIWSVVSTCLLLVGLVAALSTTGIRWLSFRTAAIVWLLALLAPLYETYFGPTKELASVGLLGLTFYFAERRRPLLGGLSFAAAIVMKVYPALFGFYFLVRRDFRLLGATVVGFVLFNLLPMPWIGASETVEFYVKILPGAGGAGAHSENAGIEMLAMVAAWRTWFDYGAEPLNLLGFGRIGVTLGRLVALVAFAWTYHLLDARGLLDQARWRYLMFSAWMGVALLLIPVVWVNYQIFLIFPLSAWIVWCGRSPGGPIGWAAIATGMLGVLLLSTPVNQLMQARWVEADMQRSHALSRSAGESLWREFTRRIQYRNGQVIDLPYRKVLQAGRNRETREWLEQAGVLDGREPAPWLPHAAESVLAADGEDELREARVRERSAALTTRELTRIFQVRPVAGILVVLGVLLAAGQGALQARSGRSAGIERSVADSVP